MSVVKSISFDETEIIQSILKLHCNNQPIELDPTYSIGNFYKSGVIGQPSLKFDINPQRPDVQQANAEKLPLENKSISVIMFDPPFLSTKGKSLTAEDESNTITKRFGYYPDEPSLHEFYTKALKEIYRILKDDGILIFKCQDKVSGGKQYFSHCFVYDRARELGFYVKDLFILLAKSRMIGGNHQRQFHSRKYHSYFWVFQKKSVALFDDSNFATDDFDIDYSDIMRDSKVMAEIKKQAA